MIEENRLTLEYFYPAVAKRTGVHIDIVRDVYKNYVKRIQECLKTEKKVMMRGLGSFQLNINKMLNILKRFGKFAENHPEVYETSASEKYDRYYNDMSKMYKEILTLTDKETNAHERLDEVRGAYPKLKELLDKEGNKLKQYTII